MPEDARRGQGRQAGRLARGPVELGVHLGHAVEAPRERDLHVGQPLGRLVGQQEGCHESHELAWRLAVGHRLPARIDDHRGDHDAAQRLHQRARQPADAGDRVAAGLDVGDGSAEPRPHLRFQVEGLHRADPLACLLNRRDHAGHPLDLGIGQLAKAADDLLRAEHDHRPHQKGDQAQQRILVDHHRHQPKQRQQVSGQARGHEVEELAGRLGLHVDPGDQLARVDLREEGEPRVEQAVEEPPLKRRGDAVADPGHDHALGVVGSPLEDREHDDPGRHEPHRPAGRGARRRR